MDAINIERDTFHGEWNYTIWPSHMTHKGADAGVLPHAEPETANSIGGDTS
jgi:hypothetical protein